MVQYSDPKPLAPLPETGLLINKRYSSKFDPNLRNLIKAKNIIRRLQAFALDDPDQPRTKRMTRTQAMVALALLRKVLPDMQALEISGDSKNPLQIQIVKFSDAPVLDLKPMPRLIEDEPSSETDAA